MKPTVERINADTIAAAWDSMTAEQVLYAAREFGIDPEAEGPRIKALMLAAVLKAKASKAGT